jgi:DNA-binding NarL/FixJ family response regulator
VTGAHTLRRKPRRGSDRRRRQRLYPQARASEGDHRRHQGDRRRRIGALSADRTEAPISGSASARSSITATRQDAANAIRPVITERELEIFERLASGKSNHDIARELSLSTNTVHNHVASILAKFHLENRIQAAVQAVPSGIS